MSATGMTLIVRNTARLVTGFVVVFAFHVALTGHTGPGGGFAGGVILAAAAVLVVLAFGGRASGRLVNPTRCHVWDAAGAFGFLAVALAGYLGAGFFVNVIARHGTGRVGRLASGGTIPLSNLAIIVKVGAGLAGVFLVLSAFRSPSREPVDLLSEEP